MSKLGKNCSFPLETFSHPLRRQREVKKFDCDLPFKAAVATLSQPYAAHSAFAD
jgi:hypothetical protein